MRRKHVISFGKKPSSQAGVKSEYLTTHTTKIHYQIPQETTQTYHALWTELHTKSDPTPEWFAGWLNRIPCGNCRSTARTILERIKPRYNDWFPWSVELHNAVNAKLGKPQVALQEAREIWGV